MGPRFLIIKKEHGALLFHARTMYSLHRRCRWKKC